MRFRLVVCAVVALVLLLCATSLAAQFVTTPQELSAAAAGDSVGVPRARSDSALGAARWAEAADCAILDVLRWPGPGPGRVALACSRGLRGWELVVLAADGRVVRTFPFAGAAGQTKLADLDGDGELEVLSLTPAGWPRLQALTCRALGGKLRWRVDLPAEAVGWGVGDIVGDGKREVVVATWRAVLALSAEGKELWRASPPANAAQPLSRGERMLGPLAPARPAVAAMAVVSQAAGKAQIIAAAGEKLWELSSDGRWISHSEWASAGEKGQSEEPVTLLAAPWGEWGERLFFQRGWVVFELGPNGLRPFLRLLDEVAWPRPIAVGDFDGEGQPELVCHAGPGSTQRGRRLLVFGATGARWSFQTKAARVFALALDLDGRPPEELIVATSNGVVYCFPAEQK